jgi:hypothetical protein
LFEGKIGFTENLSLSFKVMKRTSKIYQAIIFKLMEFVISEELYTAEK